MEILQLPKEKVAEIRFNERMTEVESVINEEREEISWFIYKPHTLMIEVKKFYKQKSDAKSLSDIVTLMDQMLTGLRKNRKMNQQKIKKLIG